MQYEELVGRPFVMNQFDCLTAFRDIYKLNFDIDVPNFARPTDWNSDDIDLIGKLYPVVGMEKIEGWDLRPGDVLATAIGTSNPNHLVIYLGDNMIFHHKTNAMSAAEPYRPFWKMVTCYVLRHPDVPDLTPVLPDVTIQDLLEARYFSPM